MGMELCLAGYRYLPKGGSMPRYCPIFNVQSLQIDNLITSAQGLAKMCLNIVHNAFPETVSMHVTRLAHAVNATTTFPIIFY